LPGSRGFLDKWRIRAAERRERLKAALFAPLVDPLKVRNRITWLQRTNNVMASRRKWLEVRLEHVVALQSVLQQALDNLEAPAPHDTRIEDDDSQYDPVDSVANQK